VIYGCAMKIERKGIRAAKFSLVFSDSLLAHKYANMNAPAVCRDLEDNHHRKIAHSYLQDVSDWVGGIAQANAARQESSSPQKR